MHSKEKKKKNVTLEYKSHVVCEMYVANCMKKYGHFILKVKPLYNTRDNNRLDLGKITSMLI